MEKNKDFVEKTNIFVKELETLKNKYNLDFTVHLDFKMYKELPTDLKLALEVIRKHNPSFDYYIGNYE